MRTVELHGHAIDYDVTPGPEDAHERPPFLLLTGWCQDHRLFDRVVEPLSKDRRVIRMDWRGHGADRSEMGDFGYAEQADDAIALLDHLGVERFVPVSTSHGGWANLEIADRLGLARVPRVVVVDWLMTRAPAEFVTSLQAGYHPRTWREGRQGLFDQWLATADCPPVATHLDDEMGAFEYEMWARSCRVIESAYARFGSPLERMTALAEHRPIVHLYSQPTVEAYHEAQREFAAEHDWFASTRLGGETHFPTLESPEPICEKIVEFANGRRA
ncbi:alpha/beta hydrolase [Streptomyces sp. SID3343]|uniref:alpha/beta fold hydrolase n=1 Tax=Streptomyces sp. SID3343 TaxID=2690260 RepID=UPI00136A6986|nr:alpha/beta hydrolase [Streptomyces sp. SID3343]MYW05561.1 alpha/beta fold hydrolase [Streptomyces sp. SID3343]